MGKFQYRHFHAVQLSIALAVIYGMRVNFHVGIVRMVNHTAIGIAEYDQSEDGPFIWSKRIQGLLLSSYFWGYILTMLPGAIIAERYSAKWVFFGAVFLNILGSLLTPLASKIHYGAMLILRLLQGLSAGASYPSTHVMLAAWSPVDERSFMTSVAFSGTSMGAVVYTLAAGYIAAGLGWEYIYYIEGGVSALWLIVWGVFVGDSPSTHWFISHEESQHIINSISQGKLPTKKPKVPWGKVFRSMEFWSILVAQTCCNWAWYTLLIELPLFMKDVLNLKISENALYTAVPFLSVFFFMIILGKIMDILRAKKVFTTTEARKVATGIQCIGPLFCFIGVCYIENVTAILILITLAVMLMGGMFSGYLANHIDIAPNFAGTLMGITNTAGTLSGIGVPLFVNEVTRKDNSIKSWRIIFWTSNLMLIIEFLFYTIFGSGEEQEWNKGVRGND
ncbi:vesicular glutamate transporter 3-like [Rhynchophorus ferrugineus]|uniref:Major facilitator superfamily (MFS) profile domain-containing protein n=1 Tax=Rhynchophorus ferrugineus TaxID=354439 RepID=A0A834HT56_RHYFE|nr:hypothetical protein GWI33_020139 [Rhynchophorus ferrugineus]